MLQKSEEKSQLELANPIRDKRTRMLIMVGVKKFVGFLVSVC